MSQFDYAPLAVAFIHVIAGVLVLIIAKYVKEWLSPYSLDQELTSQDNPAFGLAVAGYYAATVIIYLGAAAAAPLPVDAGTNAVFAAIGADLAWAIAGILALNGIRWLMDRLLVADTRNSREIIEHRNLAAGALESAGYIGSALVLSGAIRQPSGTIWSAVVLFLLGFVALILMGRLYQRVAGYDVSAEIRKGNFAAGVAFGMTLVGLALLMMKATGVEFAGWAWSLTVFVFNAVAGLALLLALRWVTDLALFPHAKSKDEIVRDRNVNVGLIEGVLAIGIAAIILFLF